MILFHSSCAAKTKTIFSEKKKRRKKSPSTIIDIAVSNNKARARNEEEIDAGGNTQKISLNSDDFSGSSTFFPYPIRFCWCYLSIFMNLIKWFDFTACETFFKFLFFFFAFLLRWEQLYESWSETYDIIFALWINI